MGLVDAATLRRAFAEVGAEVLDAWSEEIEEAVSGPEAGRAPEKKNPIMVVGLLTCPAGACRKPLTHVTFHARAWQAAAWLQVSCHGSASRPGSARKPHHGSLPKIENRSRQCVQRKLYVTNGTKRAVPKGTARLLSEAYLQRCPEPVLPGTVTELAGIADAEVAALGEAEPQPGFKRHHILGQLDPGHGETAAAHEAVD